MFVGNGYDAGATENRSRVQLTRGTALRIDSSCSIPQRTEEQRRQPAEEEQHQQQNNFGSTYLHMHECLNKNKKQHEHNENENNASTKDTIIPGTAATQLQFDVPFVKHTDCCCICTCSSRTRTKNKEKLTTAAPAAAE